MHTEFLKYKKPGLKSQQVDSYRLNIFFTKMYIRIVLPRRNTLLYSSQVQWRGSN